MKPLGYLLGACVLLAALKAAVAALAIILCVAVVIGVFTRPAETFGLLLFLFAAGLARDHGVALIVMVGLVSAVAAGRAPAAPD
jgi:hypothetical protein